MNKPTVPIDQVPIRVDGWMTENGFRVAVEVDRELTLEQLEEFARLTRVNTRLLLKLAVFK